MIKMVFSVWTGDEWLHLETFRTEDVIIALEKIRTFHNAAIHPDQEWEVRMVVTWLPLSG